MVLDLARVKGQPLTCRCAALELNYCEIYFQAVEKHMCVCEYIFWNSQTLRCRQRFSVSVLGSCSGTAASLVGFHDRTPFSVVELRHVWCNKRCLVVDLMSDVVRMTGTLTPPHPLPPPLPPLSSPSPHRAQFSGEEQTQAQCNHCSHVNSLWLTLSLGFSSFGKSKCPPPLIIPPPRSSPLSSSLLFVRSSTCLGSDFHSVYSGLNVKSTDVKITLTLWQGFTEEKKNPRN